MKTFIVVSIGITAVALSGCAATIESKSLAPDALNPGKPSIQGIVHYQPALMKVTYRYSARIDEKGKVIGTAEAGTCQPVIHKEELQVLPDFSRPMALLNRPATLAN